jgi:hypothetical protein
MADETTKQPEETKQEQAEAKTKPGSSKAQLVPWIIMPGRTC